MNKTLMTGLCFLIPRLMQGFGSFQKSNEDVTKLKLAKIYLHAVKFSRLFLMGFLGVGVCLILLLVGLSLIHQTILLHAPWDASVKVAVTLICAFSYILIAAGVFAYVFAQDKWMKMFNVDAFVNDLTGSP